MPFFSNSGSQCMIKDMTKAETHIPHLESVRARNYGVSLGNGAIRDTQDRSFRNCDMPGNWADRGSRSASEGE